MFHSIVQKIKRRMGIFEIYGVQQLHLVLGVTWLTYHFVKETINDQSASNFR